MAQYGLTPADITQVLNEQNVEVATGTLGAESDNTFQYVLKYRGRYEEEQEYANLVIRSLPDGDVLRIGDIARVELGSQNYNIIAETNGRPGVNISINQVAGSNANEIIKQIDAEVEEIRHSLPPGIVIEDLESKKDFLDASIASVVETLLEALLLVILVVWLFLGSWRSTIIPAIAIVVSLIATLAVIYAIGFSLNMLTLFALVLVIGTVVDDAIVVVEAVQTRLERGEGSLVKGDGRIESSSELSSLHPSPVTNHQMTEEAMKNITSALITTTLVFMAVFVPVCFIGGVTGTFYTQFGLTMAIAVAISLFNALTLSPALSAIIMRDSKLNRFQAAFNRVFVAFSAKYKGAVGRFTHYKKVAALLVVLALVALGWMMKTTRTGLVPNEDMGTVFINVQASPGSSLQQTYGILKEVEARIKDLPQLRIYSLIAGNSNSFEQSSSNGNFTLKLKKWDERTGKGDDDQSIVQEIYRRTADIANAKIQVNTQNMLPGFGRINGFELHVQDKHGGTIQELYDYTNKLIAALNERPEISRAFTNFSLKYPQYRVEVDAALCKRRGVSPSDVLQALSGYVGGSYASNFVRFTKLYRVMVQASPEYRLDAESLNNIFVRTSSGEMSPIGQYLRLDAESLNNIFVRTSSGEMSPIGQYLTLTRVYGSETLSLFNLFPSIQVGGTAAEGYSSGQAIDAIRETAAEVLPEGYGYEFGGMTREEASSQNTTALVFVLCIIFIYLILCALYESLFIPMAVILSVPFGLAGSFLFANLWGLENNIYMQTGLIMLIGLLSKTAILLTEYASTRRRQGLGIVEAALDAAAVRLRPILMTSMTMVFGLLPLALATGVGANGNHSLGVGTIGGMVIGTIALLFIVPVLFVVFQTIEEKVKQIFKPKN